MRLKEEQRIPATSRLLAKGEARIHGTLIKFPQSKVNISRRVLFVGYQAAWNGCVDRSYRLLSASLHLM